MAKQIYPAIIWITGIRAMSAGGALGYVWESRVLANPGLYDQLAGFVSGIAKDLLSGRVSGTRVYGQVSPVAV